MAFVEIEKFAGFDATAFNQVMDAAFGGSGLQEGQLFMVAAETGEGLVVIDAWETQEACNRSMERIMAAMQELQLAPQGVSHEQFDIHELHVPAAERVAS